jgi:hypothetical protein
MMPNQRATFIEDREESKPIVDSFRRSSTSPLHDHNDGGVSSLFSKGDAFKDIRQLSISESTRRLLDSMGEGQVRKAKNSLAQRRRGAIVRTKSMKTTKGGLSSEENDQNDIIAEEETRIPKIEDSISEESLGVPYDDKDGHHEGNDGEKSQAIVKESDSTVTTLTSTSVSGTNNSSGDEWKPSQLDVIKPPRTQRRLARSTPGPDSQPDDNLANPRRRAAGRRNRGSETMSFTATIQNTKFKPISSSTSTTDFDSLRQTECSDDDDERKSISPAKTSGWGLGGIWNRLSSGDMISGLIAEADGTDNSEKSSSPIAKSKKRIEVIGGTKATVPYEYYIRRGKKKAKKGEYLQAVALFNLALIRQRENLGEDHIDCATTLNEIGVCWMMLCERYLALSAYEEALYIRQMQLGDGAMEVAETTSNIWMILHEERCEITEKEQGGEDEEE